MQTAAPCLALCLAAFLGRAAAVGSGSPIAKVVELLEEMLAKSQENAAKDEELFAKFKAYCDKNTEEKTESVEEVTKDIALLENKIAGLRGSSGDLSAECAELKTAMDENEAVCEAAENIRQKENQAFMEEQADLEAATGSLTEAIKVLSEIGADQTMAEGAEHKQVMAGYEEKSLVELKATVRVALAAASAFLTQRQRKTTESFLQMLRAPFTGTYSSQSGEIVGILKNMLETFDANLKHAIAAEKAAEAAHQKFMKVKKQAYDAMKASYDEKNSAMGENDDGLAEKQCQLAGAKVVLAADEEFLSKLLPMCRDKARQFESRKKKRANEAAAVTQTLNILQSDAADASFQKTKATTSGSAGPNFLQLGSSRRLAAAAAPAAQARAFLQAAAVRHKSLRLANVAMLLARGNPFEVVLEKIDEIVDLIGEEGLADKENLEWCDLERDNGVKDVKELKESIELLEADIEDLGVAINDPASGLLKQLQDTEEQLVENEKAQVEATKLRAEENWAYQTNIKDLVGAQSLLAEAMSVLRDYYKRLEEEAEEDEEDPVLLQKGKEDPAPPPETWADEEVGAGGFQGQSEKGKDVVSMIEFIKTEVHNEELAAHDVEKEAQHGFEDNMKAAKGDVAQLEKTLTNLGAELREKEAALNAKESEHEKNIDSKEAVEAYMEKIKPGCDFISTNFGTREENREAEVKALKGAVEMLKQSPGWTAAVANAEQESWGDCEGECVGQKEHAQCKACLAGVTVVGYCAGNQNTEGC